MLKNYLIIAFRNLVHNKFFSAINIFGLAFGMAISIIMFMYVFHETTYDNFHTYKDQIYRVNLLDNEHSIGISAITTAGIGPSLIAEFPEVEEMVRLSAPTEGYFTFDNINYSESAIMYADSSFFRTFSFRLAEGNPSTALIEPFTIVLSEKTAKKIFDDQSAIGKIVRFNNQYNLIVTGVVEDPPENSQLKFSALISFTSLYEMPDMFLGWNGGWNYYTYIKLVENASANNLTKKFPDFTDRHINDKAGTNWDLALEPMGRIHLHSDALADLPTKGNLNKVYILGLIAFFVLIIACINFINLTTAQSIKRAREVGLRKVVGASRKQLVFQFLGESIVLSIIAMVFALLLLELLQPLFNQLLGADIFFFDQPNYIIISGLVITTLFVGLVAGSLPAMYISSFQPAAILKGYFNSIKGKPSLRNALVVFQFFISVTLIIATIIIYQQMNYVKNKELGFEVEHVLLIDLPSERTMQKVDVIKNEFKTIPGVLKVAASSANPGNGLTMNGYLPVGFKDWIMIHALDVDYDYLQLLNIEVVKGRGFSKEYGTDSSAYLINETLAKQLGWDDLSGKYLKRNGKHKIIGVVKDFHFSSLHKKIEPLLITINPWDYYYQLSVKTAPENTSEIIASLEEKWKRAVGDEPFDYSFLENRIELNYQDEARTGQTIIYLAFISIIIACLGLYGQAAYSILQRTKEIGVRKILGANYKDILFALSGRYVRIIILANLLSWPVSWYFMNQWLNHFAFHTKINWWIFVLTLLISLIITAITVISQAIKAASTNPVEALKYE